MQTNGLNYTVSAQSHGRSQLRAHAMSCGLIDLLLIVAHAAMRRGKAKFGGFSPV
jgi:hypothetical protein